MTTLPGDEGGPGSGRLWPLCVCASVRTLESVVYWESAPRSTYEYSSSSNNVGDDPGYAQTSCIGKSIRSQPVPFCSVLISIGRKLASF